MATVIHAAIEAAGLDMAEFSRAIGSHPSNCYRLRAGKAPAGPRVRAKVARALGIEERALFDKAGWPLEVAEAAAR